VLRRRAGRDARHGPQRRESKIVTKRRSAAVTHTRQSLEKATSWAAKPGSKRPTTFGRHGSETSTMTIVRARSPRAIHAWFPAGLTAKWCAPRPTNTRLTTCGRGENRIATSCPLPSSVT
jgi:hypothetical protein